MHSSCRDCNNVQKKRDRRARHVNNPPRIMHAQKQKQKPTMTLVVMTKMSNDGRCSTSQKLFIGSSPITKGTLKGTLI